MSEDEKDEVDRRVEEGELGAYCLAYLAMLFASLWCEGQKMMALRVLHESSLVSHCRPQAVNCLRSAGKGCVPQQKCRCSCGHVEGKQEDLILKQWVSTAEVLDAC